MIVSSSLSAQTHYKESGRHWFTPVADLEEGGGGAAAPPSQKNDERKGRKREKERTIERKKRRKKDKECGRTELRNRGKGCRCRGLV